MHLWCQRIAQKDNKVNLIVLDLCTDLLFSPKMIVLGGGVMQRRELFPRIHERTREMLNGYISNPAVLENIDRYIVPPGLGANSGAVGGLLLARRELEGV